jgi:hypothetical protein
MAIQAQIFVCQPADGSVGPVTAWLRLLRQRVVACANTCADYYAAAGLYEHLRGLSDGELRRRGLSRETLARAACARCDRTAER